VRPPKEGERYTALLRVESVNGEPPGDEPPAFGTLTAIAPDDRVALHGRPSLRALGQIAPLALGHRGLVLAPTRIAHAGFLRDLVDVITEDEELVVNVLLVGAPPEDITVWRRECAAEVIATPFDETQARQLQVADIAFERARRLVERGEDVVVVVDSLTRLARACQAEVPAVGRQLGDLDAAAMQRIHHYFGAARALEDGGSLTVIAVLSTETSDRVARSLAEDLDEVVTWRATLSAEVADRGVRPPLHASRCWSRGAESLLEPHEREQLAGFRASLTGEPVTDAGLLAEATGANPLLDSVARTGN
jgi:transcription termination factor Rho